MQTKLENKLSQMRKGSLEFCVLLAISGHKKMYAADIIGELQKMNLEVVEGTLYPLLSRLKKEGWLDYSWEEASQGPPRKYYRINPEGKELITQLIEHWNILNSSIQTLIQNHEKNR